MIRHGVAPLFALFALSGFTGLIYESLWSHYLGLFLGHAAYAQSFVLAVFMGGMALGAWHASRRSARLANLLAAYGWIEAGIGLIALLFHELFVALTEMSLVQVIPYLGDPAAVEAFKLALSLVLILPQAVLLGMTFPLMSGAVIRRAPRDPSGQSASGHHLAMLYFTNSIGAAFGALAAAFWLLGWFGMHGTMRLAGLLNLVLAAVVLIIARVPEHPLAAVARPSVPDLHVAPLFLAAAFVTGAASFIYEIVWIRMLTLVLGASFQAFELMLSAFVTGLALGGLWIRKRIDRIANPVRFSGCVQLAMGLAALGTVLLYHSTFDWMRWLLAVLQRTGDAYPLFNLGSHAIAFAVMLPATFLAGMTLPLFTHVLLRDGYGERAIGQVYGANTLGAIAGVLFAVHLLLPFAGIKLALVTGAALDMLLGAALLRSSRDRYARAAAFTAMAAGMLAAALVARGAALDPARLSSGVFRHGAIVVEGVNVPFYRDGKTASVALRASPGGLVALTSNGKPDASVMLNPERQATSDETTMFLTAALPLLAMPHAQSYAVIGMGSGMTTEVLLSHGSPRVVDTIEIEPAIVMAAHGFSPRVRRPFEDPRSHIHFEDAKTFFARHGKRYDVIISEPSNPWVSGVASLFTLEFYRDVKRHLAQDGIFAQWLQVYELEDRLLYSVFAALDGQFADYALYELASGDIMVLAVPRGRVPRLTPIAADESGFREQLARVGMLDHTDLEVRLIGTRRSLAPMIAALGVTANSDFRPVLQLEATRARFINSVAAGPFLVAVGTLPILEMLYGERVYLDQPRLDARGGVVAAQNAALELHRVLVDAGAQPLAASSPAARLPLATFQIGRNALCGRDVAPEVLDQLHWLAERTLSHLGTKKRYELWVEPRWIGCAAAGIAPAATERLMLYRAIAERDARAMHEQGRALLESTPPASNEWQRFVLLAAMLGAHASGSSGAAAELWRAYSNRLFAGIGVPPDAAYLAGWKPD